MTFGGIGMLPLDFDTAKFDLEIWLDSFGGGAPEPTEKNINEFKKLATRLVASIERKSGL
jgi:hypothetical protein